MIKAKHQLLLDDSKESDLKLWDNVLKYRIDCRLSNNNEAVIELLKKGIRFKNKEE
jgi:hypothetical protein